MASNEVKRLTKADILQGKNKVEYVYIEELEGEIPLRPLTDGQFNQVEVLKTAGIKVKGKPPTKKTDSFEADNIEIDIEQMQKNDFEADCVAVGFSIADGETWTVEDVKKMPAGAVAKIAKEVYRITGLTPQGASDVKSFRRK